MKVEPTTIRSILDGWDGDEVELHLVTGAIRTGQISLFMTGDYVAVGVDTPEEVIYRIDAIIGVRWVKDLTE